MSVTLKRIVFMWTPINNPMHHRPFESGLTPQSINMIENATRGGLNTGIENLAPVASHVLRPANQSKGLVEMPYGWGEGRYAVMAMFETSNALATTIDVLTGYTSYAGITPSGAVDTQMQIFFNGHTTARPTHNVVGGRRTSTIVSDGTRQVLKPIMVRDPHTPHHVNGEVMLRPVDTMAYLNRESEFMSGALQPGDIDTRSTMNLPYVTAKRDSTISTHYLSSVMGARKAAAVLNQEAVMNDYNSSGDGSAYLAGYMASNDSIREFDGAASALVNKLISQSSFGAGMPVTVGEMQAIWPNFSDDRVKEIIMPPKGAITSRTDTEGWGGSTLETTVAYSLCHLVPAIMSKMLLTQLSFVMDNRTLDRRVNLGITGAIPMADLLDMEYRLESTRMALMSELSGMLAGMGVGDYTIKVQCNTMSTLDITLMLNGATYASEFSAPAYCDAIYTPVISTTESSLKTISNDLGRLLDDVYQHSGNTVHY